MIKYLKRDEILNAADFKTEDVDVPEWGGTVVVKSLSGSERDSFEASLVQQRKGGNSSLKLENIRAKLVSKAIIDPDTKEPMFTAADIEMLGTKSAAALDRVFSVAQKLSKITDEDIEELEKN